MRITEVLSLWSSNKSRLVGFGALAGTLRKFLHAMNSSLTFSENGVYVLTRNPSLTVYFILKNCTLKHYTAKLTKLQNILIFKQYWHTNLLSNSVLNSQ